MRRDLVFNGGTDREARFRVTATKVRREVILDAPLDRSVDLSEATHYRMRFALSEAEALVGLLMEAITAARD